MKPVIQTGIGLAVGLAAFAASSVLASDSAPKAPEATLYSAVLPLQAERVAVMYAGGNDARKPLVPSKGTSAARLSAIARRYGRDVTMVRGVAVLEEGPAEAKDARGSIQSAQDWLKASCGDPRILEAAVAMSGTLSRDLGRQLTPGSHAFTDLTPEQRRLALNVFQLGQSWSSFSSVQSVLRPDDSIPIPPGAIPVPGKAR